MAAANHTKEMARTAWVKPLTAGAGPRYLQIADLIGQAIQSGELRAGDQIPAQRWLATELGVDLTTVTRAYTEARNRGLIASFSGRGSYVVDPGETAGGSRIDLTMNIPPQPADGSMAERVRAGIDEILTRQRIETLSIYQDGTSNRSAIQAAQAWLRPALGDLDSANLTVCAGAQAAIFGILSSTVRRGDTVLCEPLTYPGFLLATRKLGVQVIAVECDEDGVMPDALERAQRGSGARLIYLNPTLHNPTARTMPAGRRQEVAAMLRRLQMTLIEDDPYRYLLNDAPPPLVALTGGERTYYLASLSKCLWPSLRTAFVLPPRGDDGAAMREGLGAGSMGCSALMVALAEHWIRSGTARQLVQEIQREARARQNLARAFLPPEACAHPTGIHIWLPLPARWSQHLFAHALDESGVTVACADSFSVAPEARDAVRISVGGAANQAVLGQALQRIAALLQEDRRRGPRRAIV